MIYASDGIFFGGGTLVTSVRQQNIFGEYLTVVFKELIYQPPSFYCILIAHFQ